jgi:hypothetical protein
MVCAAMLAANTFAHGDESAQIRFTTDVVPVLTKLGCNSGGCHGKATGQNGFKLSLLGFEPEFDYQAIVKESRGRRILPGAPEHSLVLVKATNEKPHGGGQRTSIGSEEYDWRWHGRSRSRRSCCRAHYGVTA